MYDLNRVTREFNEACRKAGVINKYPVKINGRLTATLGRVKWLREDNNTITPIDTEFSKLMIETATDETIRGVILHEAAHLIAIERTGVDHGHDSYFKSICAELGTTNDGCHASVESTKSIRYKYNLVCPVCGIIGGYSRRCKTVEHPEWYSCKCGNTNLRIIERK